MAEFGLEAVAAIGILAAALAYVAKVLADSVGKLRDTLDNHFNSLSTTYTNLIEVLGAVKERLRKE